MNKKLKEITTASLSNFFSTHKTEKKGKLQPLSASNAKKLYNILQSLFKFAESQGIIKETPCRNVILPKKKAVDLLYECGKYLLDSYGLYEE